MWYDREEAEEQVEVGWTASCMIAGSRYVHRVTKVISPKTILVAQVASDGKVVGSNEKLTMRRDGSWRKTGTSASSRMYWNVYRGSDMT